VIWEIDEAPRVIEGIDDRGRPIPSYAASLGLRPAPFGRRTTATAIEVAVVVILLLPFLVAALPAIIGLVGSPDPQLQLAETPLVLIVVCTVASSVLTTAFIVVQMVLHGRRGVTLGKALVGIRSVNVRTLERPGFWRGEVVRYLVMVASFIVPVVGPVLVIAVSPFFDTERRGRGWPDLAGATWFVDVRHGLNPYDIKRMRIARKTAAANLEDDRRPLPSLATPVTAETPGAYVPVARSSGGVIGARRADVPAAEATPTASTASAAAIGAGAAAAPGAPHGTEWASAAPASQNPSPVRSAPPDLITAVPGASAPRAVVVAVRLDTGETIAIEGSGLLIGRAPAAAPGEHGMQLLALPDDGRSVSKTHLALLRSGDRLIAMDRASTNGSSLVRAGIEHPLAPGEGLETADGDTIRFGDRSAQVMIGRPGPGEEKA
jgi:uncharacterized RDD family membrane protein YckC